MKKPAVVILALVATILISGRSLAEVPSGGQAATVRIDKVSPDPTSQVDENSIVRADVTYYVPDFPGAKDRDFVLMVQFATNDPKHTTNGSFPDSGFPILPKLTGTAFVSFPLKHVWNEHEVQRPLTMWVYLVSRVHGSGSVIAKSDPVVYRVN